MEGMLMVNNRIYLVQLQKVMNDLISDAPLPTSLLYVFSTCKSSIAFLTVQSPKPVAPGKSKWWNQDLNLFR